MFTNKKLEMRVPSKEATADAMRELSQYLSTSKQLRSNDHPELTMRGQREDSNVIKPDPDSLYREGRLDNVYDDDI